MLPRLQPSPASYFSPRLPDLCIWALVLFCFLIYVWLFILALLGLHCCTDFSLVVVSGRWSAAVVRGLLIAAASLVVERRLWGTRASVIVARGLSSHGTGIVTPWHVGSFQTRDQTHVSCAGRQILYHWITREAVSWTLKETPHMEV